MNLALWILQAVIGGFFAMAGLRHALTPRERLAKHYPWVRTSPPWFLRFIGGAEVAGAIGLILPMALSIAPKLSIAAALGLALLMGRASAFHFTRKEPPQSVVTLVVMLLVVFIAVGRMVLAPA